MLDRLSNRERQIANLVATGEPNRAIAEQLGLRPRTVETHIASAFNKLGVNSRVGLTAIVLRAEDKPLGYLPQAAGSFVGRELEIAEASDLLKRSRIVTVTGSGGIGKTSLAREVARSLRPHFPGGVWFVALAALSPGATIEPTIIATLDAKDSGRRTPLESLIAAIGQKTMLLVLDNCEQVIQSAATVAAALLSDCAHLRIFTTSREALGIPGEHAYRLRSLGFPAASDATPTAREEARAFAALALFDDRAAAASGEPIVWSESRARAIANICRRLDGIPLAIELAAARTSALSCEAIDEQLDVRLDLLAGANRGALPRHRTLRASIDWSYELLDEPARELFRFAGIFSGGFTAEAIASIRAGERSKSRTILSEIAALVDKSLIVAERESSPQRFRLLESMRAYALECLESSGELDELSRRHARYFADIVTEFDEYTLRAHDNRQSVRALLPDLDNVRIALTRSFVFAGASDAIVAARLAAGAAELWVAILAFAEAIDFMRRARKNLKEVAIDATVAYSMRLDAAESMLFNVIREPKAALDCGLRALPICRDLDDRPRLLLIYLICGHAASSLGQFELAADFIAEGERFARELGLQRRLGIAAIYRGTLHFRTGRLDLSRAAFTESARFYASVGILSGQSSAIANLCDVLFASGEAAAAIEEAREAYNDARAANITLVMFTHACNLAGYLLGENRLDEARESMREALDLTKLHDIKIWRLDILDRVAALAAREADLSRAAWLFFHIEAVRANLSLERYPGDAHTVSLLKLTLDRLPKNDRERYQEESRSLTEATALALAEEILKRLAVPDTIANGRASTSGAPRGR